jgi:hypothetical protein
VSVRHSTSQQCPPSSTPKDPIPRRHTQQRKYLIANKHIRQIVIITNNLYRSQLTPGEYHKASDLTLESILDVLETIGDEHDIDNYDVEYSQGVLTLKLGAKGTYVLNKQPPNQQIWLSSPKRFEL